MKLQIWSKWLVIVLFLTAIITGIMAAGFAIELSFNLDDNNRIQERRINSIILADELRQSSDDLTNFARLYCLTGDPVYKTRYNDILLIRDGKKPRPVDYNEIYWDFVNAGYPVNDIGNTVSIYEKMEIFEFSDEEKELIQLSKERSDELAKIESSAFIALENNPYDYETHQYVTWSLYNVNYLKTKAAIMEPLAIFYKLVDKRTSNELHHSNDESKITLGYLIIVLMFNLFSVIALRIVIYVGRRQNIQLNKTLNLKSTYLEHAARIIRHDMHSGINTYMPRGIKSLNRRLEGLLSEEDKEKIKSPMQMITGGLDHTQKAYMSVYEFTNLVKLGGTLNVEEANLEEVLSEFLKNTSYKNQVYFNQNLPKSIKINRWLFCVAVDNLIKNGLTYNDSSEKIIKVYRDKNSIIIEDNGRGMSKKEFISYAYHHNKISKEKESGSGLGLNISVSIIESHGFKVDCKRESTGTKIIIKYT